MGVECPLKPFQDKVFRYTEFVADCIPFKSPFKSMGTLVAAYRSEISVLDYAINRLDQKECRHRLRAALAELGFDQASARHAFRGLQLHCRGDAAGGIKGGLVAAQRRELFNRLMP